MYVEEIMTLEPHCIETTDTVKQALEKMMEYDIRHLPVLNKSELVGMVSDRDIRLFSAPLADDDIDLTDMHVHLKENISEVMQGDVLYVDVSAPVSEAIRLMIEYRIGAVPVMDAREGALVGIVSYIDVLKAVEDKI